MTRKKPKPPAKPCRFELNPDNGYSLVHQPGCDGTCSHMPPMAPAKHTNGVSKK